MNMENIFRGFQQEEKERQEGEAKRLQEEGKRLDQERRKREVRSPWQVTRIWGCMNSLAYLFFGEDVHEYAWVVQMLLHIYSLGRHSWICMKPSSFQDLNQK